MAFFQFPTISSQVLSRGNAAYTRRQEAASKKRMITTVKTAISRLKDCCVIASYGSVKASALAEERQTANADNTSKLSDW
jgi:hypothetical protein